MAKFDLTQLEICEATPADYDDVIAINPWIYDGLDYVHAQYMEFIHNTHAYPYVARYNGKIVSYIVGLYLTSWSTCVYISMYTMDLFCFIL